MSMVSVPVPREVSRLFTTLEIDGNRTPSDHITILNLGDALLMETIVKTIPFIYNITSNMDPFLVTAKRITTFPSGENGYPIIAPVEAPQLHELHNKLKRVFKRNNINYSDKYPKYKPHVTLGYHNKKINKIKLPKTQWQVNEIALYCGDQQDERIYVSFPLSLNLSIKKSSDYIFCLAQEYKAKTTQDLTT